MKQWHGLCLMGLVVGFFVLASGLTAQDKKKFEMTKEEQRILELTNKARVKEGLKPFKPDPRLFQAARGHSKNMAKHQKLEHELDGKVLRDRINAVGYRWSFIGENVGWGDPNFSVEQVVQGWMDSPLHRKNILEAKFTEIGLGRAVDEKGVFWYTQVFAKPLQGR